MAHTYHLTRVSENSKTGPLPVTTSSRSTCPSTCPLKGNGCYPEYGPLTIHWDKVSDGTRGTDLKTHAKDIKALPRRQLWRWGQAGDLPGDGTHISHDDLDLVVDANRGKCGWAFTHYDPMIPANATAIATANQNGFTINLSANNVHHADQLFALGIAPVVVILPKGTSKPFATPAGNWIAICPATQRDDVTCATCAVCQHPTRKAIIGFPVHGSGAKKAHAVALS